MKATAEKSSTPTALRHSSQPFFGKAGGGDFFPPVREAAPPAMQMKMKVNEPGDKFEQEADRMAGKVMRMAEPAGVKKDEKPAPAAGSGVQRKELKEQKEIQRKETATPTVQPATQSAIQSKSSGGEPLSPDVRSFMEPRFGADFSTVKVHTDQESGALSNQVSARAFTFQNHVFFSHGQYQPGTSEGKQLLAHELTHTIQQGHSIQRAPQVSTTTTPPPIQRFGMDTLLDKCAEWAGIIPGFRLLTIIIGTNPINGKATDRSAANILRALIELIPGGFVITQALDNHGVFTKCGAWVEEKIRQFSGIGGELKSGFKKFIDSLSWSDALDLGGVWDRAKAIFTKPIGNLLSFVGTVASELLKIVKDAVLKPLAGLAQGTKGYDLLRAVLGEDPITGEKVPRNAETLIGGFMKLIGQEEVWANIQKGNAIQRAWIWFQGALNGLMAMVLAIPGKIKDTFMSLTFQDILTIAGALGKIIGAFVNIALDFMAWGVKQVLGLLEIIFSAVAPEAMPYIAKAKDSFNIIIKDPIKFVGNLVRAGKLGFEKFRTNFLTHLKNSLINWITGPLGEAGVYIPKSFDLIEVVKLVLSILGLTWTNIRTKLVKIIPDPILTGLEKGAEILTTLVKEGPVAAWQQIKAELGQLKDQLIAQVTDMIQSKIVEAAVMKLVSMLNPAGAVIQAIIAVYKTITFFIEKAKQIGAVVASFIDSVSAIAAGQVEPAAKKVEETMAKTLTVVLAFLAKFLGFDAIPAKLVAIINKIRKPIDAGLDKIVAWLGKMLEKAKDALTGKNKDDKRTPEQKLIDLQSGIREAELLLTDKTYSSEEIRARLQPIAKKYKLVKLELVKASEKDTEEVDYVSGEVNPTAKSRLIARHTGLSPEVVDKAEGELDGITKKENSKLSSVAAAGVYGERLLSKDEYAAGSNPEKPFLGIIFYGTLVEKMVKGAADPSKFLHVGGPGKWDFEGKGKYKGLTFDVTTEKAKPAHDRRVYGPRLLYAIYDRLKGFWIFPPKGKK